MRFSQRIGKKPEKKEIQIDEIDPELKIRLWNIILTYFLEELYDENRCSDTDFKNFSKSAYHDFYKFPMDELPYSKADGIAKFRKIFFDFKWFEIYDKIEFIISFTEEDFDIDFDVFIKHCNHVLEGEFSGYRIVNNQIAPITNELEIKEIESAIEQTHRYTSFIGSNVHLHRALEMLSDKSNPDYRNSIKESISAIESISKVISGNEKDSLAAALDKIKGNLKIHQSLEKGFKQLYGYTSDNGGIRHALMDNKDCYFEDALFMLVSCSAFVNYLIAKTERSQTKIQ